MQRYHQQRGATMVFTAIVMFVLIGFVGLALDWGHVHFAANQLQAAADASALAGAQQVKTSQELARTAAIELAALNEAGGNPVVLNANLENASQGDIVVGIYDRADQTFTPGTSDEVNAVQVVARLTTGSANGPLPLFFGPMFGKQNADVARRAIAITEPTMLDASIIALNDDAPEALYLHGNPLVDMHDGWAQVNSTSSSGLKIQGTQSELLGDHVNVGGSSWSRNGNPEVPDIEFGQPNMNDPLSQIPEPVAGSPRVPNKISNAGTYMPGYYTQGLDIVGNHTITLLPGVYVLDNGYSINNGTIRGAGVMIFVRTGSIQSTGGDTFLTPPLDGPYKGISFFQARSNTNPALFVGNGALTGTSPGDTMGTGVFYIPSAKLEVGGTADWYISKLIADTIEIRGNAAKHITSAFEPNAGAPKVYLVE